MAKAKSIQQLLGEAAAAVAEAEIPEDLRAAAFKEAFSFLRDQEIAPSPTSGPATLSRAEQASRSGTVDPTAPDEATFFSHLAEESGVQESDLRDVLRLTGDGQVQVTPPTRMLGATRAEQAKSVIAIVSSGRAHGLRENPVNAERVRPEVKRKGCYQQNNFASNHLGAMKGFNAGNRNEIVLTSRWIDDFNAAITKALGRESDKSDSSTDR